MLFNSFEFFIFFPLVTILYFLLPHKFRWLHLLIASCVFYMYFIPAYILILFFTIVIDYFAGIWIQKAQGNNRKFILIISLVSNIGILAFFKYYNFFAANINGLLHLSDSSSYISLLNIILPIGLSFHTFQAMSYTIEVYRGNIPPERHLGYYALYVMFFPQLVAGPIERPQNVLPQFHRIHSFNHAKAFSGLRLILWGLFKKVVIADRLGDIVNEVYNHTDQYHGFGYIIATIFFGIQIYCDFSGYSDIAIGSARVMGFDLMTNFKRPYFSATISEFWRRWHISLSSWFRDYVYIPLGGKNVSAIRRNFNLFIVFLISGFWHGASWNFIIWGSLHGIFLICGNFIQKAIPLLKTRHWVNVLLTFLLVNFAWIFFRASTVHEAMNIVSNLFSSSATGYFSLVHDDLQGNITYLGLPWWKFLATSLLIPFLFLSEYMIENGYVRVFDRQPVVFKWSTYYFLIITVLLLGLFDTKEFIYFQF